MSEELLGALHASPHYQRSGGRDHVLVASYYKAAAYLSLPENKWTTTLVNMTVGPHVIGHKFKAKSNAACVVPVGHQASSPADNAGAGPRTGAINHTLFFVGRAVGPKYYSACRAILEPGAMNGIG